MILLYVLFAGVALLVYWRMPGLSRQWRIAISLIVFLSLCGAATVAVLIIGDRPAPGDRHYNLKEDNAVKPIVD
jgi:hypothetical protein